LGHALHANVATLDTISFRTSLLQVETGPRSPQAC